MKRKTLLKRITSAALASVMALMTAFAPLPGGIFAGTAHAEEPPFTFTVSADQMKQGVNILPLAQADDEGFLNTYVRKDGTTMSLNSSFQTIATNDISNAGSTLTRATMGRERNGNGQWKAEFEATLPEHVRNDNYELRFEARVKADYHYNVFYNAYKHWDLGYADIYGVQRMTAKAANDEEWQNVSTVKSGSTFSWNPDVIYHVGHEPGAGCECGSSAVTGSTFYLVKKSAPQITKVYLTSDEKGEKPISGGLHFDGKEKLTAYAVLEFSEDIRFSDNVGEKIFLNLDAFYTRNNRSVDKDILTATLSSMTTRKMIFAFSVPNQIDGSNTDIYVSGISSDQSFIGQGFNLKIFDKNGKEFACGSQRVANYLTDLVGNPLNWEQSNKSCQRVYFDNINPTMTKINMTGSMVTNDSVGGKDSWDDGTDRSAVFAGVGDWISFQINFSENVKGFDVKNVKAILRIKDQKGNTTESIKLAANSYKNNTLHFEQLVITETMKEAGSRIEVTGFEGLGNVTDSYGNALQKGSEYSADLKSVSMAPSQGIYLDVDAPVIATESDVKVTAGNYEPYASSEGEYFTFPLKIQENVSNTALANTSQVNSLMAEFAMVLPGEQKAYSWYVDSTKAVNKNAKWSNANTGSTEAQASKNRFPLTGAAVYYVHIRLDAQTDYDYAAALASHQGVYFAGTLHVSAKDFAGNQAKAAYPLKHLVDTEKPELVLIDHADLKVDYDALKASLNTSFAVQDNYAIASVTYQWTDTTNHVTKEPVTVNIKPAEGLKREFESGNIAYEFPFASSGDEGRVGSAQLNVVVKDFTGNVVEKTTTDFAYDFRQPVPVNLVTGGTATKPLLVPSATILAPTGSGSDTAAARTVMFVKIGENADGTNVYWGYDPRAKYKNDQGIYDVNYSEADIIDLLMQQTIYGSGPALPGFCFKVVGNIDVNNRTANFVGGPSGSVNAEEDVYLSTDDYHELGEYLRNHYGSLEMIFVTSQDFNTSKDYFYLKPSAYNFIASTSQVEAYTAYLGNNANYEVKATKVKDASGNDAESKFAYETGKVPAKNLDNAAVTINITNVTANESAANYNLAALDLEKSNIELHYFGKNSTGSVSYYAGEKVYEWSMANANEQTVVIPAGVAEKIGWYGFWVTTCNANGTVTRTKLDKFLFMDPVVLEFDIDSYDKTYHYEKIKNAGTEEEWKEVERVPARRDRNLSADEDGVIELALGTAPNELWTLDTELTFTRTQRPWEANGYVGTEFVKVRVYNKADTSFETNAVWRDAWKDGEDLTEFSYTPVCVDEITKASYGTAEAPALPLYEGDNLICFEIQNTNGEISKKEIAAYVTMPYEGIGVNTEISEISPKNGEIMEMKVTAELPANVEPLAAKHISTEQAVVTPGEDSVFGAVPSNLPSGKFQTEYTFRDDMDKEFYVVDQNGNLYAKHVQIENVDGEKPLVSTDNNAYDTGVVFNFQVWLQDHDGAIDTDAVTLTFDKDYSALLMGLTGEERDLNEKQITMKIPINLEQDAEGNYIPWESYEPSNYGIFKTLVTSKWSYEGDTAEESGEFLSLEIMGTWKYDKEVEEGDRESRDQTIFTITAEDANGNKKSCERKYGAGSVNYRIGTGIAVEEGGFDWYQPLYPDGILGIYSEVPFSKIYSYGAGEQKHTYYEWAGSDIFYTTAPMIQQDGIYKFQVTDLFGENYELETNVYAFGDLGVEVGFSETETTNQDVTVYAMATLEGDTITEIYGTCENGKTIQGTIDEADPKKAEVVMPENGSITIQTALENTRTAYVLNIDKKLEPVKVVYYTATGEEATNAASDTVITAQVAGEEYIYGTNGALTHVFPRGSKKGETYTFEFADAAGNTGSIQAVLPCDISPLPESEADKSAPQLQASVHGQRNQKFDLIAAMNNPDAAELNNAFACYGAQEYRLVLTVTDDSATKIVVTKPDEAAPRTYEDAVSGSTAEYVTLKSNYITITENTAFNVYVIDENNNVTALEGISVTELDKVSVEYTVAYESGYDEEGLAIVTATFLPVNPEEEMKPITVLDKTLPTRPVMTSVENPDYDPEDEYGYEEPFLYADRYYYVFRDNGAYNFRYRDEIGNMGEVLAQVQSMSTAAAVVEKVLWIGTAGNAEPGQSAPVNKNVTADFTMSKAVSSVKLYVYDEEAENGLGEALPANAPVSVTFAGTSVHVTYEANTDYKVAVQFRASASGKTGYYVLPEVTCIDKTAPVVTLQETKIAANKRSMTLIFTTDEETMLPEDYSAGYTQSHEVFVRDNQAKELKFSDKAGNLTVYNMTENAVLDMTRLEVVYSIDGKDEHAVTDAVNGLELEIGDSFYVKANKAADVKLDNEAQGTAQANVWMKLTLPEEAGVHMVQMTDLNTGEFFYDNVAAQPKDRVAPEIHLDSNSIVLLEGASTEAMLEKVKEGISITDDVDGKITAYEVTGYPETTKAGLYTLTYRAQDQAGNETSVYRTLYIMKAGTPLVMANGEAALPYGNTILSDKHVELETIGIGTENENLVIKWRSGMRTTAQMKHSTETVTNMEFTVPEDGFYTIYVRTQDRVEYVTYIYVEE